MRVVKWADARKLAITSLLTLLVAVALFPSGSFAQGKAGIDYTARKFGAQFDLGFGFTKGRDAVRMLKDAGITGSASQGTGFTFRFGFSGKFRMIEGFYLQPTFQMAFFNNEVTSGQGIQLDQWVANRLEWSNSHISFGVIPAYYLDFADLPIRPFGGLGLILHVFSSGDVTASNNQGQSVNISADQAWEVKGKKYKNRFGFGLSPMIGVEYNITDNIAIPAKFQIDLVFPKYVYSVYKIQTGFTYYF